MGTELHWPRRATFIERSTEGEDDEERRYSGPGTFEVPDDAVEAYLEAGWERPDGDGGEESPPAAEQETDADADSEEGDSEEFDAEGFVDDSWQAVVAKIEDGEADGHLDAVEDAENDREGGPRESSVIEAIEERQG